MTKHSRARVILANDDDDARRKMRIVLEGLGCTVIEVRNEREAALAALKQAPLFMLIFLDSDISDWLDVLVRFKEDRFLGQIPIIATSSDGSRGIELFTRIADLGEVLIEYLPQPFSSEALAFQIDHLISRR